MGIASDEELARGWWGTAFWVTLALLVLVGDGILYFIYWNLLFVVLGVFIALGGLIWVAMTAKRRKQAEADSLIDD